MHHHQKTYNLFFISFFALYLLFNPQLSFGQNKAAQRYEIDAKRIGVSPTDKDALPRSREFIRLDSTYYVGWMYEGIYKYERSADYLGYKFAAEPLRKAFDLLEKDFGSQLRNLYSSFIYYNQYNNRLSDLYQITYALQACYNSIEMPDSTMALLDRIEKFNFQKDFIGVYNERAWIFHRNRFFTSEKYKFLKNSVEENEDMAFRCCYYQLQLIQQNRDINDYWFGPGQSKDDILNVEHNLALMHCYMKNYDSATYHYQRLIAGNRVSWGNYANMQHEMGNIDSALTYYNYPQNSREHALSEPDYYLPSLLIYGGNTKAAITMAKEKIDANGSTPGFGWYNIALARGYLYDGQLDSADFFLEKAKNFKELHLHTTLTQSQYEFSINLLKLQLLEKRTALVKFLNKGWWYNFSDLYDILSYKFQKLMLEYVVVNELANNPERKRLIYDLFCGESTVTFDEVMHLLQDFSSSYFIKRSEYSINNDKRLPIRKYFKLFHTRLKLENDEEDEARAGADELLTAIYSNEDHRLDTINEKLFLGRLYEVLAITSEDDDDMHTHLKYQNDLLTTFPQLMPFSGITPSIKLTVSGNTDENTKQVIEELNNSNINWGSQAGIPEMNISINKTGKNYRVLYNVINANGKTIIEKGEMIFQKPEGAGKELAMRLFGKGGDLKFQPQQSEEQLP